MPKKKEEPAIDDPAGEDTTPNITTMPPSDTKEALMIKWVESVDARFLQYHELLAELATLPQRVADAQRTIELSVAARVAREELKIMIDAATAGIMAGIGQEVEGWRQVLEDRLTEHDRAIAAGYKHQIFLNGIMAGTAVLISIAAVIIMLVVKFL